MPLHNNSSWVTVFSLESHTSETTQREPSESQPTGAKPKFDEEKDVSRASSADDDASCDAGLPPMDRGKDAYLVLAAAFILQGLVPGFPFAFGVFQEYYSTDPQFSQSLTTVAAVGTSATGIFFFAAPFMYAFFRRFLTWRKPLSIVGFFILVASLVIASFANTITQLLATQGVMYAIGGLLLFYPVFLYLDEWWMARKGFAYGVVWAGACASGIAIPLLMQWLLETYGFRTALRTWACVTAVFTVPALIWLKPRLPEKKAGVSHQKIDLGFLRDTSFWVLQAGNIFNGLGYNMPILYLPLFAQQVGLSALVGTLSISLMNAANIVGSLLVGVLTDRYHVTVAINVCAGGTVLAVLLLWTFATTTPVLLLFAIAYGVFAGGFSATWAGCADPVRRRHPGTDTGMIVSMFQAGKGVGSLVSGPLSGALVASATWKGEAAFAFGSGYGTLIVFTAITASLSFIGWIGKKCGVVQ